MAFISNLKAFRQKQKDKQNQNSNGTGGEKEMSFLDHLEELRWHILRGLVAVVLLAIAIGVNINWFFNTIIYAPLKYEFPTHQLLCRLTGRVECTGDILGPLIALSPYEQFLKSILIAVIAGIIFGFPYLAWEAWRFIKPGLHKSERKTLRGNVAIMSILFFIGVAFAYYIILPFAIRFLAHYSISENIENTWQFGKVITMVTQVVIAGGILFEMPIVIYYLTKMGLVTPATLKQYRRLAIVILLVLSAIITPPDVISQILIFCPLILLYEISIGISRRVVRNQAKAEAADAGIIPNS